MSEFIEEMREPLKKPMLKYDNNTKDAYTLRFRLPNDVFRTHKYHKNEPLLSIVEQLKYDMQYHGGLMLIKPPLTIIDCELDMPISSCGIYHMVTLWVTKA